MGYLLICIAFALTCLASLFWLSTLPMRLGALVLLSPALFALLRWFQLRQRALSRTAILARLTRLPDDFTLLHNLTVRAPWGPCQIDYVILSRFGIVVAATGPDPGWVVGQVEALRSMLFRRGVRLPSAVVRPLTILSPGCASPLTADTDAFAISVRRLTLEHLAPSATAVLTQDEIRLITRCLMQAEQAA